MKEKKKLYLLIALFLLLLLVYVWNRPSAPGSGILASNPRFQPLSVQNPQLRMDLIAKIRATTYSGTHRNIFSATPPPPPTPTAAELKAKQAPPPPPPVNTGPPPLVVPATFFGYAADAHTGHRLAFFQSGDDVTVIGEGGLLLDRFRLLKIGNDVAEFEEVSTGRHASLPITQPVDEGSSTASIPSAQDDHP